MDRFVIIVPFNNPVHWPADYNLQTCYALAAQGHHVLAILWAEPKTLRTIVSDLLHGRSYRFIFRKRRVTFIQVVHFLPFPRFRLINTANQLINVWLIRLFLWLCYLQHLRMLWIFSPEFAFLSRFFGPSFFVVYDCVEYFSSVDPQLHKKIKQNEFRLIHTADLVAVNSKTLFDLYRTTRPDIALVPQGFALDAFTSSETAAKRRLPFPTDKPVIGYVGGMNFRLDFSLLHELVGHCKNYSFVFVGPRQIHPVDTGLNTMGHIQRLLAQRNVHWIDVQPRKTLAYLMRAFDVALIPYDIRQEFNRFCFPMKILEYFYLGKPVVSTPIQELIRLSPFVSIASNASEFHRQIRDILKNGWSKQLQKKQRQFAIDNSWENKIEKIFSHLEKRTFHE